MTTHLVTTQKAQISASPWVALPTKTSPNPYLVERPRDWHAQQNILFNLPADVIGRIGIGFGQLNSAENGRRCIKQATWAMTRTCHRGSMLAIQMCAQLHVFTKEFHQEQLHQSARDFFFNPQMASSGALKAAIFFIHAQVPKSELALSEWKAKPELIETILADENVVASVSSIFWRTEKDVPESHLVPLQSALTKQLDLPLEERTAFRLCFDAKPAQWKELLETAKQHGRININPLWCRTASEMEVVIALSRFNQELILRLPKDASSKVFELGLALKQATQLKMLDLKCADQTALDCILASLKGSKLERLAIYFNQGQNPDRLVELIESLPHIEKLTIQALNPNFQMHESVLKAHKIVDAKNKNRLKA
jgi:hypothetical protein